MVNINHKAKHYTRKISDPNSFCTCQVIHPSNTLALLYLYKSQIRSKMEYWVQYPTHLSFTLVLTEFKTVFMPLCEIKFSSPISSFTQMQYPSLLLLYHYFHGKCSNDLHSSDLNSQNSPFYIHRVKSPPTYYIFL